MRLKMNHNSADELLTSLITEGDQLLSEIKEEYHIKRANKSFDENQDIQKWKSIIDIWYKDSQQKVLEIFSTQLELGNFQHAQGPPHFFVGENMKFGGLRIFMEAKLNHLNVLHNELQNYTPSIKTEIFIEDVDNFQKARNIKSGEVKDLLPLDYSEDSIQTFLEEIIGENFHQKDWGGENLDLLTSHLKIGGQRNRAVFLLKGNGTKGKLTLKKCGKNGDQRERLAETDADMYVVQHVNEIDLRVVSNLKGKIELKNTQNKNCRFCVIDGTDTARILKAYKKI